MLSMKMELSKAIIIIFPLNSISSLGITVLITYLKKLLDSDWLRKECKNV